MWIWFIGQYGIFRAIAEIISDFGEALVQPLSWIMTHIDVRFTYLVLLISSIHLLVYLINCLKEMML